MKNNAVFTSTLPVEILEQLHDFAKKLNVPKNQLLEKSLRFYFEQLKRAEYMRSYQRAAGDAEQMELAEQGLKDYLKMVESL